MPYAPIIPLIRRAGLGPCATLARFSEVTQGRGGDEWGGGGRGGSEIDFICFLSSFAFQVGEDPSFRPLLPPDPDPLHVSPQINNNPHCPPPPFLPTSPPLPCLYSGGETTDFLPAPSVCFSKRQHTSSYHFSMFCSAKHTHTHTRAPLANKARPAIFFLLRKNKIK